MLEDRDLELQDMLGGLELNYIGFFFSQKINDFAFRKMSGVVNIPILEISQEEFRKVMTERREPLVLRGSDLGSCTRTWSPEILSEKLNPRQVKVHVGQDQDLDFRTKNFKYCDIDIKELVKRAQNKTNEEFFIDKSEVYYLRQGLIQFELITNHFCR